MLRFRLDQNTKKISDWNKHFQLQINEPVFQIKEKLQLLGFVKKAKMMLEGRIFIRHQTGKPQTSYSFKEITKHTIKVATSAREELIDITLEVKASVKSCGIRDGLVVLYAHGATAAIMIQENWDASVRTDVIHLLQKLIPR